jgi:hypothetical protein
VVHVRSQHPNAVLTPAGRRRMVDCVLEKGLRPRRVTRRRTERREKRTRCDSSRSPNALCANLMSANRVPVQPAAGLACN